MANIKTAQKYVSLAKKKEKLEADLKKIKAEMDEVQTDLLEYFQSNGLRNLKTADRTVSIRREVWASLIDKELGCQALKDASHEWLVTENANGQTLSSWIREMVEKEDSDNLDSTTKLVDTLPLPDALKAQLKVTEKLSLRVTK